MSYRSVACAATVFAAGVVVGWYWGKSDAQSEGKKGKDKQDTSPLEEQHANLKSKEKEAWNQFKTELNQCRFDKEKLSAMQAKLEIQENQLTGYRQDILHYLEQYSTGTYEFKVLTIKLAICQLKRRSVKKSLALTQAVMTNRRNDKSSSDIIYNVGKSIANSTWKPRQICLPDALDAGLLVFSS